VRVTMSWFRPAAAAVAVLMALTCAAPLAAAGESVRTGPPASTLSARAAVRVAQLQPTSRALMQAAPAPAATAGADHRPFFKTPTGVAALLLMAAGATYLAVSIGKDNSKVHSPIR
jgi:hypothetical protein